MSRPASPPRLAGRFVTTDQQIRYLRLVAALLSVISGLFTLVMVARGSLA